MRVIRLKCLTLLFFVFTILHTSASSAQELYNAPTEGVLLPSPSATETSDATAVAVNPANLGFLDSWSFVYNAAWVDEQKHLAGQGHGFFFAFPAGPLGFGIGTELLLPHEAIREWQGLDKRGRLSLAMSLNPSKGLGLGIAYRRSLRYDYGDTIHSLDLGISIRPINHLSVSLNYIDANTPQVTYRSVRFGGGTIPGRSEDAPKRLVSAITLRPFGDDRVAVGAELHYMHGNRKVFSESNSQFFSDTFHRTDLHAIASVLLTDGISLRGRFVGEGIGEDGIPASYYMDAALSIDSDRFPFGVTASPRYKLAPASNDGFEGMSVALRFSGDVPPSIPLMLAPRYIVPIELDAELESAQLASLMAKLERIKADRSVDMVLLKPRAGSLSLSKAMEIRRQVLALNAAGKDTLCYIEEADAAAYLSCSAAKAIWVNPAGGIRLAGLSTQMVYFRSLLDKIGVKADIVRIGQYKSAPESFTETGPTGPSDRAMNRYMDSVYNKLLLSLQRDRSFESADATRKVVEQGPFVAVEAVTSNLADRMVGFDQLEAQLEKRFGTPVYMDEQYGEAPLRSRTYLDSPSVAVLHIEGDIVDGESVNFPLFGVHTAGAKTLTKQIRDLKEDSRIQTVVLRINSPGGSALASDIIWRELMALRKVKPVVASMGDVAASGAYYIASAADVIFAESTTLTGSIGIYYGKADISGLLDKVGISTKTYARGEHADAESWTRMYTPEERKKLGEQIRKYYGLFLRRVSEGRGGVLSPAQVDKLGRGRIWSGADARHHQLVDRIGGYQEALDYARAVGHVAKGARVHHLPKPSRDLMTMMARGMGLAGTSVNPLMLTAKESKDTIKALLPFALSDRAVPQARLPFAVLATP